MHRERDARAGAAPRLRRGLQQHRRRAERAGRMGRRHRGGRDGGPPEPGLADRTEQFELRASAETAADGREVTMKRAVIVIPAYEPTPALADLVAELSASGDRRILVINDGSSPECRGTFERVARCEGVVLLEHAVNLGKGQALKTAFNYVLLNTPPETVGVVTADADGQHLAADIRRVADRLEAQPATLVLGS